MSRVGKKLNKIEAGIDIESKDSIIIVKGPKGSVNVPLTQGFTVELSDGFAFIKPPSEELKGNKKALFGLYGSLLSNAITGVTIGFTNKLNLVGVGYKAQVQGNKLILALGYSHPVEFEIPEGLQVKCNTPTEIEIWGVRKDQASQFAAVVRASRPPEPYKGKGVLRDGEKVRRKQGKAGKK